MGWTLARLDARANHVIPWTLAWLNVSHHSLMGLSLSMLVSIAVSSAPVGMYDSINSTYSNLPIYHNLQCLLIESSLDVRRTPSSWTHEIQQLRRRFSPLLQFTSRSQQPHDVDLVARCQTTPEPDRNPARPPADWSTSSSSKQALLNPRALPTECNVSVQLPILKPFIVEPKFSKNLNQTTNFISYSS